MDVRILQVCPAGRIVGPRPGLPEISSRAEEGSQSSTRVTGGLRSFTSRERSVSADHRDRSAPHRKRSPKGARLPASVRAHTFGNRLGESGTLVCQPGRRGGKARTRPHRGRGRWHQSLGIDSLATVERRKYCREPEGLQDQDEKTETSPTGGITEEERKQESGKGQATTFPLPFEGGRSSGRMRFTRSRQCWREPSRQSWSRRLARKTC